MTKREQDIIKVLAPFLLTFPECKLDETGLKVYAVALSEYEPAAIKVAMEKLIKSSKFFPRVADIIEAIASIQEHADRLNGGGTLTAGEAWEDVQREIKRRSYYSSEPWQFANKEVEKAARQFGLLELSTLEMDGVNTARAQFMRIYDSIMNRAKEDKANEKLFALMDSRVKALFLGVGEQKQLSM